MRLRTRHCATAAVLVLAASGPGMAELPTRDQLQAVTQQSQPAARASLGTFAKLLTPENSARMGFDAPGDAARASLGTPLVDYTIGLIDLQNFGGNRDPADLLRRSNLVVYPVVVDGTPRSTTIVARQGSEWKAVSFGSPLTAAGSEAARQAIGRNAAPGAAPAETFQVRVPALNIAFVGQNSGGNLLLTPTLDFPEFGLAAGRTEPAREVLNRLVPFAREQDPNVPR